MHAISLAVRAWLWFAFAVHAATITPLYAQTATTDTLPPIGKKYSDLRPEQKLLVDDWFRRFSRVIKKNVSPDEGYEHLPLSAKTTFSAVTHALIRTPLTDKQGAPLADSAIVLVDKIDDVAGKISGAGGDKQFRIYVQLKPGAMELLSNSKQFSREDDNTVYHHGYPVCFRGSGGAPSIQISISKDAKVADIDVDYRSSKFPAALFNGHLSADNSDVRAGDNDQRHNRRWEGLGNWWRTLLGLPFSKGKSSAEDEESVVARAPRVNKNAKAAVYDFLTALLVEQKPEIAMGYFSQSALPCMEVESGVPLDRGMARIQMFQGLQELNRRLGKVTNLSQATVGIRLNGPKVKVIKNPHHAQFVLYDVREDLAEEFKCANKLHPENASLKASRSHDFGKYVGAVFKLRAGDQWGETVATLWAKESDFWKLISYDVEPKLEAARTPRTAFAAAAEPPALPYVEGDGELIHAASDFAESWLVRKQVDHAFQYLAPASYGCVNLYRSEETSEANTGAEQAELMKSGMQSVADKLGTITDLRQAIAAPQPSHPDLKLVRHPGAQAFALVSIPDYMAANADCARRRAKKESIADDSAAGRHGNFYAMGFKLAATTGDPAVLWLAWTKQDGRWRIVSFAVISP